MNTKWCEECGNPGPFRGKRCVMCGHENKLFLFDLKEAYVKWLKYQDITGKLMDEMNKLVEEIDAQVN